jgi:lysozyme family protein
MADLQKALEKLAPWEWKNPKNPDPGGYTDLKSDLGGPTRWGITEKTAREHGYTGDMKDLPYEFAAEVYRKSYWDTFSMDKVLDQDIANQVFQAGVNQGTARWKVYLQQACNSLLPGYAKLLAVDGVIGPKSIDAINQVAKSGRQALSSYLYKKQESRYDDIVTANPGQSVNRKGWGNRSKAFLII